MNWLREAMAGQKTEFLAIGLVSYLVIQFINKEAPDMNVVGTILAGMGVTLGARVTRNAQEAADG